MNISHVLCPIDFSPLSDVALAHATALAKQFGATLHFVHVYEPVFADGYMEGMSPAPPAPADLQPINDRLESLCKTAADDQIECCHDLIFGFPAGSLVGYATTNDVDLIVMGTHGRSGASRLLLGSVAEAVVRAAHCPVLTVHEQTALADA